MGPGLERLNSFPWRRVLELLPLPESNLFGDRVRGIDSRPLSVRSLCGRYPVSNAWDGPSQLSFHFGKDRLNRSLLLVSND